MSRLLVFQHVAAEPLGTLDPLIRRRGHRVRYVNFERHPDHEPNVDRYRGLIVLGGPMNVEDHERRAHLRAEMRAIERMLHQGKPVLGICLGAQLLAHVLGAPIRRIEVPEIGWHRLHTTPEGRLDPVLGALGEQAPVFQWHSYRFDIPAGAVHLARTDNCEPQAFRHGDNAYGFQFHLEMDQRLIERWLAHPLYRDELLALTGGRDPDPAATVLSHTREHIATMQAGADTVFNRFLDQVGRPQRRYTLPSREWA
ncbi:type 1 glutamine amidotransferase [Agrilutibacter solisilvae]|uniref:Gamma-glutamyl-gamma-aminobutyrate hydrolase family protein n=1 Tax=Agrilutibacter solisilvae TaxID=2763317 RepID=A0A974XY26_9GAMM|nr:gamma-glutamyl-gamma-aminobutyrate hydrolase family protein [Lysobacter solisilvae]QSX77060.1 gamma-glutamyl-gamma-aminobutyrate hydrolase family protein [Lysobacter solisilvae]